MSLLFDWVQALVVLLVRESPRFNREVASWLRTGLFSGLERVVRVHALLAASRRTCQAVGGWRSARSENERCVRVIPGPQVANLRYGRQNCLRYRCERV